MLISAFDTETCGLDTYHGCKPFFLTCSSSINGEQQDPEFWEWAVSPLTRKPKIILSDFREIEQRLDNADEIVWQNAKFDIAGLAQAGLKYKEEWWQKTHDTLYSGHLLASGEPHSLDVMALRYLNINIHSYEQAIDLATKQARALCRKEFPTWKIATSHKSDDANPDIPSADEKLHKYDMWLPRAVALAKKYPYDPNNTHDPHKTHPWYVVCQDYGNTDGAVTLPLWIEHKRLLHKRGLWKVYLERRKLIRIIHEMERDGVTYSHSRKQVMYERFTKECAEHERICLHLAGGKLTKLPKGSGVTKELRELIFTHWKLPPASQGKKKKTDAPSLDKLALETWQLTLDPKSVQHRFIENFAKRRKKSTSLTFMDSYERFGIRLPRQASEPTDNEYSDIVLLHPSINGTGSRTLRMTSQNPNEQNISKQKDDQGQNVRYCFGPAPGREWWSLDYKNLELVLPAYEAGEKQMLALFERPNDPPYFGSYHLLVFDMLHPEKYAKDGPKCKDLYKDTWYQWTKNGNFADQYRSMVREEEGVWSTADKAYHIKGAQVKVRQGLSEITKLDERQVAHAREHGFVWTITDKEIGSGYPLQILKDNWGKIKPTEPLSYHIQGTAMWVMCKAMIRCKDHLVKYSPKQWPNQRNGFITLQVHDEMVFDLPAKPPTKQRDGSMSKPGNLAFVLNLRDQMKKSGEDIGIPLGVDVSYHPNNWAQTEDIAL